ncbi:MAG: hypothetical protein N2320_01805 [Candidatus Bipolaricaulota bacterium]|nr:hypothetical protein [Candidatus Bipolaricaulota bacterium]
MLAELARYLLRAVTARPAEAQVEHIRSGDVDFLFFRAGGSEKLAPRDQEALATVVERIGARAGWTVIADWK